MNQGHTLRIEVETPEGYFMAPLNNGGVRVGLKNCECFDFPPTHPEFARCTSLTAETVEAAHDEFMGRYTTI